MKNPDFDPNNALKMILNLEDITSRSPLDIERRQDIKVQIRVNESVGPGMFRPDPLVLGGYIANSLTIRAMRPDIFVLGNSLDDLSHPEQCACGKEIDLQFWKLCPYCGRNI